MRRHTKIISTLGPASLDRQVIAALIAAGTDVVRLNFSHGTHKDHRTAARRVREEAERQGRQVAILQDLQGPRIRVGVVKEGSITLEPGRLVQLTCQPLEESTCERISISYDALASDVSAGGRILIDDGRLELRVIGIRGRTVEAQVEVGGELTSNKGVNLPRVRTSGPALTPKDETDLRVGLDLGVDLVALSFVRNERDIVDLRRWLSRKGSRAAIIAKIEKPEALDCIDRILAVSDGIMVARGDLGIEMPMAEVPAAQKSIIHKCLLAGKPVITATQMLESMIRSRTPTRAEASDVANAVLDGSDAVMLSGETAVGIDPARVVQAMSRIIASAERHWQALPLERRGLPEGLDRVVDARNITDAVTLTACELAAHVGANAMVCLTSSGATARALAKHRPRIPVYAFTDEEKVVGQLGVLWGTRAFAIPFQHDTDAGVRLAHEILLSQGLVREGDPVVVCAGMPLSRKGPTNMVHVSRVQ
ncbi:MAG: pyruvate kinase [Bacteroidota bacterium]|nr:pyruvate kinase [Bacteroidota bacterium]MDE2957050.1 pyruvate kinase [Bacteroidota bacterium]